MVRANFRFQFSSLHFMLVSDPVNHTYLFFFPLSVFIIDKFVMYKILFFFDKFRSSRPKFSYKKDILENFLKFTRKYFGWSHIFNI